jgi:putative SOS response-associated peptidase YedK
MFITIPEEKPFAFAGLWETWKKKPDSIYNSCAIITTQAGESFSEIHHRMPVILKPEIYEPWLDPQNNNTDELKNILKNEIVTKLISYPVSKKVNSASNNNAACIEPIA